jgi:signal transduction histidine kinase
MRIGNYLAGATTLVIAAVTSFLVMTLIAQERTRALKSEQSAATMFTDLFAGSVSPGVDFDDVDAVAKDLDNLQRTGSVVAAAIWIRERPEAAGAFGPPLALERKPSVDVTPDRMIVTRAVVDRTGKTVGLVRLSFSLDAENAAMAATKRSLIVGGLIVMIAVVALLTGLTRRLVVQPLQRLAQVAEKIQQGDLRARATHEGRGEIATLARAFNDMGDAIAQRAEDLSVSNQKLTGSLEELKATQTQLVEASRRAGMADVATTVLHNVGNVLNSVNVSAGIVVNQVRASRGVSLGKAVALLEAQPDRAQFLAGDPRGKKLIEYFGVLAKALDAERDQTVRELEGLTRNIDHIKAIVSAQQSHAKTNGVLEVLSLSKLVDDALTMNAASTERHVIEIVREYAEVADVEVDRHKVLQILVNLISNSRQALRDRLDDRRLTVRICSAEGGRVAVEVEDNGVGIAPENVEKIFKHGVTTKVDGHGFGLHSSGCAAMELGGSLRARSEGLGHGATFILEFPAAKIETSGVHAVAA